MKAIHTVDMAAGVAKANQEADRLQRQMGVWTQDWGGFDLSHFPNPAVSCLVCDSSLMTYNMLVYVAMPKLSPPQF